MTNNTSSDTFVIPDVPVPDESGQASYQTDKDLSYMLTGEGLSKNEKAALGLFMAGTAYISDGMFPAIYAAWVEGLQYFWNYILPDNWKAHGVRDYLYGNVYDSIILGDATYRDAKEKMLADGVPNWQAFPKIGIMGADDIVGISYFGLQLTWNKLRTDAHQPINTQKFNTIWRGALTGQGFYRSRTHIHGTWELTIGGGDEYFNATRNHWPGDPTQADIDQYARMLANMINEYRVAPLRKSITLIIKSMVSAIEDDAPKSWGVVTPDGLWQDNWRWCKKCEGLFFAGRSQGVCPSGGSHDSSSSCEYILHMNQANAQGPQNWRWCNKCQGLYDDKLFSHNKICPAGGAHNSNGSSHYILHAKEVDGFGLTFQSNWYWCEKCGGLFYLQSNSHPICPAGGPHKGGHTNYVLRTGSDEEIVDPK